MTSCLPASGVLGASLRGGRGQKQLWLSISTLLLVPPLSPATHPVRGDLLRNSLCWRRNQLLALSGHLFALVSVEFDHRHEQQLHEQELRADDNVTKALKRATREQQFNKNSQQEFVDTTTLNAQQLCTP